MRILVVEDNDLVADAIVQGLVAAGFAVDRVASAELALGTLGAEHFDLTVIDVGLPGMDGLTLVRRMRAEGSSLPVIILTARDTLAVRVESLNLGADDFLMKPFAQEELVARCRALIRRANMNAGGQVRLGRLRIDVSRRWLSLDDQTVDLTAREWAVLECLVLSAGRLVSKERLQQAIAGFDQALTPNAVEVYISRVRAKLSSAVVIRTVRGLGYRLDEPAA